MPADFRVERDSMGELQVPSSALWGAQTQRAVNNFPISGLRMPPAFVRALALIKWAAARTNRGLGLLPENVAGAIEASALEVANGMHADQFPIDVFQTGSGTSSNMNANEVIARLATRALGSPVHPNDHVNMSQSSNDSIPSAIHIAAALELKTKLEPALEHLAATIEAKAGEVAGIVKTGRTHLMDAMPVRLDQELGGWAAQVRADIRRLQSVMPRLTGLAQGGTAVGTGINAHPKFGDEFAAALAKQTGVDFHRADDFFEALSSQDTAVELSGQLKTTAVSIMKIANDLRWMNSGPLAGLAEIALPDLQPGSSIMPGKVNPVIPEAAAMVAAQVIGNDATITIAGQSGNFQLNVMLPIVALNLLQSIELLANVSSALADAAIKGFKVNKTKLDDALERNPILVTALNSVIGYDKGAAIAKQAYKEGRAIRDVAAEQTKLKPEQLRELLDPLELTKGGIKG
ncbi:MAG TPA: class II fumarate hydratase [Gammaproteobacteria bacterium]|nr:class II fumarate hydratase [Gammaproteobacteria bacterium]